MNILRKHSALVLAATVLFSCNNVQTKNHGPIVLGDSSMIVTETDPDKLKDLVADLKPEIKTSDVKDSIEAAQKAAAQAKPADTAKKTAAAPATATQVTLNGNGLKADFSGIVFLLPDVVAKQAGNPNLSHANGAVYSFVSGSVAGNQVQVTPNVTKVSQRYQTVIAVKNELGTLPLETLTTTTGWQALKGTGNTYKITGLDPHSLEYSEANRNGIRVAVSKAARRHRFSRRKTAEWEESVHGVRASDQKPCYVILRSIMWKIDGKDANGRAFSKQIRLDMPL